MAKLVWRVKLVSEAEQGVVSETEVARIERDDLALPSAYAARGQTDDGGDANAVGLRSGCDYGRAVPVLRALRGETAQQGLLPYHVPLFVRRR
jgi:hypothetical protein